MVGISDGILLIDDDVTILHVLEKQLNALGYKDIVTTVSASKALSVLQRREFGVVISDLNMPGMDGIQFLRCLAKIPVSPAIILLSGVENRVLASVETLVGAFGLPFLGAVSKPVTPSRLRQLLSFKKTVSKPESDKIVPLGLEAVRHGLRNDAIRLMVQPKVRLKDMRVAGVEALARWQTPEGVQLGAGAFVDVAEKNGMISMVTEAMIDQVLQTINSSAMSSQDMTFSINISTDDLNDVEFTDRLIRKANAAGVPMNRLLLEITESRTLDNLAEPLDILSRLRMRGVALAIDDFGTGASGFDHLRLLPFTELKIDRSFVDGVSSDKRKQSIVASMVDLARAYHLTTVAEGVETEADLDVITELGCDMVQGYLFAAPMRHAEFLTWLDLHNRKGA